MESLFFTFRYVSVTYSCGILETRGQLPAARRPHVALATFLCDPSHDLGISQCKKYKTFLLLRNTDINMQCYCWDIQQILAFLMNLYCPKVYHRPDHSICIECHRKIIFIHKPIVFIENQTQDSFLVCDISSCSLVGINNFVLCAILLSCFVSELQKPSSPGLEPRTVFRGCGCNLLVETNKFGLGALLSSLVSELQDPLSLGLELKILFRSFDHSVFSSWTQGISMLSLVQIRSRDISEHTCIHTHEPTISICYVYKIILAEGQTIARNVLNEKIG
jgi:hypothetical protein